MRETPKIPVGPVYVEVEVVEELSEELVPELPTEAVRVEEVEEIETWLTFDPAWSKVRPNINAITITDPMIAAAIIGRLECESSDIVCTLWSTRMEMWHKAKLAVI